MAGRTLGVLALALAALAGVAFAAYCNDGACNGGETCISCPIDCGPCVCGDGVCQASESQWSCPADCGAPNNGGALCGDGVCHASESQWSCPADCGVPSPYCGDGACNNGETCTSCPGDCGGCVCGDGVCQASESQWSCPADCGNPNNGGAACGDGVCQASESQWSCPADCGAAPAYCNDGSCSNGETCTSCPVDCGACVCGDGTCQASESSYSCPADCGAPNNVGASCGDGVCHESESQWSCPADCGSPAAYCGDGSCNNGETCISCPGDCGACACGDGVCQASESPYSCPADCGAPGNVNPVCGDGMCAASESQWSCPADCGAPAPFCNDGACNNGETCISCPIDCGACVCGDGVCQASESPYSCVADCGAPPPSAVPLSGVPDSLVSFWNEHMLDAVRALRVTPPMAARGLAIMHLAIFDAVNHVSGAQSFESFLAHPQLAPNAPPGLAGDVRSAVSTAAQTVLNLLYPSRSLVTNNAYYAVQGDAAAYGAFVGASVAANFVTWRQTDGSAAAATGAPTVPKPAAGAYVYANTPTPLLPGYGSVTPFYVTSVVDPGAPPPLNGDTAAWSTQFHETKSLGSKTSVTRTADQSQIAEFWADNAGTATPPGHWNSIAQTLVHAQGLDTLHAARAFALLDVALADAAIHCWRVKYAHWFWRPDEAIHAGSAGDAADASWQPFIGTPPFPEYTSGHSTFSGAAGTVLEAVFGDVPFVTGSDALPGVTRSFTHLATAVDEAGQSRIYGGIHFQAANQNGKEHGKRIAQSVVSNILQAKI